MGDQTDQEDTVHEGQPNSQILSQVGLQQGGVEEIGACHLPPLVLPPPCISMY